MTLFFAFIKTSVMPSLIDIIKRSSNMTAKNLNTRNFSIVEKQPFTTVNQP